MCSWYNHNGPQEDVILSSRVRLARNFEKFNFPNKINNDQAKKIILEIKDAVLSGSSYLKNNFEYIDISKISNTDKISLLEKHLVSRELIMNNNDTAGSLICKDENVSIMLNEEDHIRIQSILAGMQLREAWELSDKVDNLLEEKIEYAFDESIGYLTSCPTNVGTGMRASVMVHLPALDMIGYINGLITAIGKLGITVRGLYGEGSQAEGNIFQISNQITLGQSEQDVIENLNDIISQIVEKEREAREKVLRENKVKLEDKIFRSYGIFTNARLLSSNEVMNLLSDIRLGVNLEILKDINLTHLNELMVITQPASIQKLVGSDLNENERDIKRAEISREKLLQRRDR